MGRLIDVEEFERRLIKCAGIERKTYERIVEVLNNTPTVYDADKIVEKRGAGKEGKPIIRHCENCKYGTIHWRYDAYCHVKYKTVEHGRIAALFCRHFRKEE